MLLKVAVLLLPTPIPMPALAPLLEAKGSATGAGDIQPFPKLAAVLARLLELPYALDLGLNAPLPLFVRYSDVPL